ncbi:MAG TPA: hypothetical protein TECP_00630 [Hyphomicrobiaceae bacterium MAG_BT-2024]
MSIQRYNTTLKIFITTIKERNNLSFELINVNKYLLSES